LEKIFHKKVLMNPSDNFVISRKMITSKRYCNNCADEGPDYEGRKPKTQEILGWYEVTDKEKKDCLSPHEKII